jgi:hypothetical protein
MNFLWNFIKKSSKKNSESFGHLLISRLESFHSVKDYDINEIEESKFPFHFSYFIKYIIVLSVFLIIGLSYYLISYYVFYIKFGSLLANRPKLLNDIINFRISFSVFEYWLKNTNFKGLYDFQTRYPTYMALSNAYNNEFYKKTSSLHFSAQSVLNRDYSDLIGTDLLTGYLIGLNTSIPVLTYGSYSAISNLILESSYLLNAKLTNTRPVGAALNANFVALGKQNQIFLEGVYNYSKNFIQQLLQYFIMFSCLFSAILLVLYAVFYYSFFQSEEEKTRSLSFISLIIVSSKYNEQDKK